jgi:capsular polysaccharide biosynthesis protein
MRPVLPFLWKPKGLVASLAELPASHALQQDDVSLAVSGNVSKSHPLMVTALPGGKVIGDLRLVATRDDVVIGGMQSVFGCEKLGGHYALRRRRLRFPKYRRGTALLLGASNSNNYYHWMGESLPRWQMLQSAGWRDYDFVLLHSRPCRFQEETLDWLRVPDRRRLRCSKNFVHQFERLVVPVMPFAWEAVPTWVGPWLRSLAPQTQSGLEKIYLSRRGAPERPLANEAELLAALTLRGFTSLQPEQLSVAEQAKRLGSARCIVGPHGAAMANMVFAPPGALVVEFFHPQYKNPCYENLAAACGHRYACLDGHAIRHHKAKLLACTVDVAAVLRAIGEYP